MDAVEFIRSLDLASFIQIFWYTVVFEIPRYTIGAIIVLLTRPWMRPKHQPEMALSLSVVLAGHNEAASLRACVESLREQTLLHEGGGMEVIVVDDGSTDDMFEVAQALRRMGLVDEVLRVGHRGGKSAAINLGLSACTGEIIMIVDVDTTFDRDACALLLDYFADPQVGAVSGNIGVRNLFSNLLTSQQGIEYAISISLGRSIQDALGMLAVVSGAFGAYRRAALEQVGRQDVEVGEDADLTMKLRRAGWLIRFAPEAHAQTSVPEGPAELAAQRLRWDRAIITIWMRKFRSTLDPRISVLRLRDVAAFLDIVVFQILLAFLFPVYLIWLFHYLGILAGVIIAATLILYTGFNMLAFTAAHAAGAQVPFSLIAYVPLFTIVQVSFLRVVRIVAFVQELVFRSSYRDTYVPGRVMSQVDIV